MNRSFRHLARLCSSLAAIALCASMLVNLAACQTVKGLGKDVQDAGAAGERAIDGDKK